MITIICSHLCNHNDCMLVNLNLSQVDDFSPCQHHPNYNLKWLYMREWDQEQNVCTATKQSSNNYLSYFSGLNGGENDHKPFNVDQQQRTQHIKHYCPAGRDVFSRMDLEKRFNMKIEQWSYQGQKLINNIIAIFILWKARKTLDAF